MRWLLWKDYRQNRLVVFTALFLVVVPHLFAVYAMCKAKFYNHDRSGRWLDYFGMASAYSLAGSQLAVALIGGNAIAGERVDRSAEFLFSLPFRRRKLLASKLLLALAIAAVPWLVNGAIILSLFCWIFPVARSLAEIDVPFVNIAITGLTFFCVGWFLSSFLASPAYSICGGLAAPIIVAFGIGFINYLFELQLDRQPWAIQHLWRVICLTLSPPCFALGTWLYLRRVEP